MNKIRLDPGPFVLPMPTGSTGGDIMEIMSPVKGKTGTRLVAGPSYAPAAGKTCSLFGNGLSTDPYHDRVRRLADEILRIVPGEESLLALIRKTGGRKRLLAKAARRANGTAISAVGRRGKSGRTSPPPQGHRIRAVAGPERFDPSYLL